MKLKKLFRFKHRRWYLLLALVLTNTLLLFVALNIGLGMAFWARDRRAQRINDEAHRDRLSVRPGQPALTDKRNGYQMMYVDMRSYENVDKEQVHQVLDDFFDRQKLGFTFSPYVHFSEPPMRSPTLNIGKDAMGFEYRLSAPTSRALASKPYKVFVFGGSTVLGYHVADDWTLTSYLQQALDRNLEGSGVSVEVVNYGRNDYSWFQELVLFQRMLHGGQAPNIALFLDGVNFPHNGSENIPRWSKELAIMWDKYQFQHDQTSLPNFVPVFRAINYFHRKKRERDFEAQFNLRYMRFPTEKAPEDPKITVDSYLNTARQIQAIAKAFGVVPLFVWQPHRAYRCETEKYSRALPHDYIRTIQGVYQEMEGQAFAGFHNLSNLCEKVGQRKMVFVDDLHYSPEFNRLIAESISLLISPAKAKPGTEAGG